MPPLLWLILSALLGLAQAWLRGDDGRTRWDYKCSFEGQELADRSPASSSHCGQLCLEEAMCSHWSYRSESGTCSLQQGASNAVVPHSEHLCGFVPSRFSLDEAQAFDLELHLADVREELDGLTSEETETALRLLNSFRSKRGQPKLRLDPRLILTAHQLAATCRDVPMAPSMRDGDGFELVQIPGSLTPRGFNGQVHAVSIAAAQDSSVKHAIEWWTSATDRTTGLKPALSDTMGVVGFAKRKTPACNRGVTHDPPNSSFEDTFVWTLLLGKGS